MFKNYIGGGFKYLGVRTDCNNIRGEEIFGTEEQAYEQLQSKVRYYEHLGTQILRRRTG